jgi:hypothetical protein
MERQYNRKINNDDEIYPYSVWIELVEVNMVGNYDGSGYWVKDGMASTDEVFHTPPLDATHVVWYAK